MNWASEESDGDKRLGGLEEIRKRFEDKGWCGFLGEATTTTEDLNDRLKNL